MKSNGIEVRSNGNEIHRIKGASGHTMYYVKLK